MRVGIPALAGLSILHGLVPPHPGPLVAIDAVGADLGLTLLLGLVVAVPYARGLRAAAGPVRGELGAGPRDGRGRVAGRPGEVRRRGDG